MKKFKFKLEPVLMQRKHREDIKKKELAEVFRELKNAEDFLLAVKNDFNRTQASTMREESLKRIDIEKILLYESYMIYLRRLIEETLIRIEGIKKKLDHVGGGGVPLAVPVDGSLLVAAGLDLLERLVEVCHGHLQFVLVLLGHLGVAVLG